MTDLEQLRADLAVLERYSVNTNQFSMACAELKSRIAELEAKADPWREAKAAVEYFRGFAKHRSETDVVKLVDHLTAENERLAGRVAELERSANLTPVSLKRADEVRAGDSILESGKIRTVTEVYIHYRKREARLSDDFWSMLCDPCTLVAVVNGAMGEGETRPLKKGCDDGK